MIVIQIKCIIVNILELREINKNKFLLWKNIFWIKFHFMGIYMPLDYPKFQNMKHFESKTIYNPDKQWQFLIMTFSAFL